MLLSGCVFICPYEDLCGDGYIGGEIYSVDEDVARLAHVGQIVYALECYGILVWHGKTKWWRIPIDCFEVLGE